MDLDCSQWVTFKFVIAAATKLETFIDKSEKKNPANNSHISHPAGIFALIFVANFPSSNSKYPRLRCAPARRRPLRPSDLQPLKISACFDCLIADLKSCGSELRMKGDIDLYRGY